LLTLISRPCRERPMPNLPLSATTFGLLVISDLFMTFARQGYLEYKAAP
jgi:uncharacterized protein (DUF486 family)